jgi:hypothetical protein
MTQKTYLGEEPDTLDALELLCLAEGSEVTHYEVLSEVTKKLKQNKFAAEIRSILKEEKEQLNLCPQLAKENNTRS